MLDWLTWPADVLLSAGAFVAGLFVSEDAPGFVVIQMMVATLVLTALVALIVYGQWMVQFWRSALNARRTRPERRR